MSVEASNPRQKHKMFKYSTFQKRMTVSGWSNTRLQKAFFLDIMYLLENLATRQQSWYDWTMNMSSRAEQPTP